MKKFPHLVQMHKEFASKGLVCMSVDAVETEPKEQARVLDFLKEQGATFPNFILKDDNPAPALVEKFPTEPSPIIILFNRKGQRVKVLESEADLENANVEALVKKLLDEAP